MRRKKRVSQLVYIISSIIAVVIIGIIVSLFRSKKETKFSPNNSPSKNPNNSLPNSDEKLTEKELKRYLLEKRLELKKYFVFNLQKEVKAARSKLSYDEKGNKLPVFADEERPMTKKLASDLTKLANDYWKQLKEKPTEWKTKQRTEKNYTGKDTLSFGKQIVEEWEGDQLNEKINNGENWFIVFEKNDLELWFHTHKSKKIVGLHEYVTVPVDASSCHVFKEKQAVLDFLKDNDPALSDESL